VTFLPTETFSEEGKALLSKRGKRLLKSHRDLLLGGKHYKTTRTGRLNYEKTPSLKRKNLKRRDRYDNPAKTPFSNRRKERSRVEVPKFSQESSQKHARRGRKGGIQSISAKSSGQTGNNSVIGKKSEVSKPETGQTP